MANLFQALDAEVDRFRAWAATFPVAERSGEWETFYPNWEELYNAFFAVVSATAYQDWNETTASALLYAIARDNEGQHLAEYLGDDPDKLLYLAERAVSAGERDTKWQLAEQLGTLEPQRQPAAEALLLCFVRDEDEYVRRRALLALARIGASHVEELARLAWEDGHEYQRIAALCALDMVESPLLAEYAARPEANSGEILATYAAFIREMGTLRGFTTPGGLPVLS